MQGKKIRIIQILLMLLSAAGAAAQSGGSMQKKFESLEFSRLDQLPGNEIESMIFTGSAGNPELGDIRFRRANYILSDGTAVPSSRTAPGELFVWKMREYAGADKTIFIFPDYVSRNWLDQDALCLMTDILAHNPGKKAYALFQNRVDRQLLEELADFYKKDNHIYADYSRIFAPTIGPESGISSVSPLTVLALDTPGMIMPDISTDWRMSINSAQRQTDEKRIDDYYDGYYNELIRLSEHNFGLSVSTETRKLVQDFEKSIQRAAAANNPDNSRINEINELQKALAEKMKTADFIKMAKTRQPDSAINDLLIRIDTLCGSDLENIFLAFSRRTAKINADLQEIIGRLAADIEERKRVELISSASKYESYSLTLFHEQLLKLEDNSISFIQADEKSILDFLSFAIPYSDVNIVVYYSPRFGKTGRYEELPRPGFIYDHSFILSGNYFESLYTPGLLKLPPEHSEKIRTAYILARAIDNTMAGQSETAPAAGETLLRPYTVPEAGELISITAYREKSPDMQHYIFIPDPKLAGQLTGKTFPSKADFIANTESDMESWEELRQILLKYLTVEEAVKDF